MNCSTSVMPERCLFLHVPSSRIRHSEAGGLPCHNWQVLDLDEIRRRIASRFDELEIAITGNWDKDLPISKSTVRHFISGDTRSLSLETVSKLTVPLKTSEEWILFGDAAPVSAITEEMLSEMVATAFEEIEEGMSPELILGTVASNLHEQLRRKPVVGSVRSISGAKIARDKFVQSAAPTRQGAPAKSRTA